MSPDHEREAQVRQEEIYRAMTPRHRLEQALRLRRAMKDLLAAGFRDRHPSWSEQQVQRAVADSILYARTG
jgi:hypothetical protein